MPNILIVEDEEILRLSLKKTLQRAGYVVDDASNFREAEALIMATAYDVAILDIKIPEGSGLDLLRIVKEKDPETQVIMMTAHGSIQTAVTALKDGAFDYLTKPLDIEELRHIVRKAIESATRERELQYFRKKVAIDTDWDSFVGESPGIKDIRDQARSLSVLEKADNTPPPPILITGETGTGKGFLAKLIHHNSNRKGAPFIEINCTSIPENMVEAELFGFEKGAFTDAKQTKRGLFEIADKGTLFLDEIGHMPVSAQAKLLKCIEDNEIRRLGSTSSLKINVRIIAATNRDLEDAIRKNEFRRDLYHRLKVFSIHLPPLRERGDDILLLARGLLVHHAAQYGRKIKGFTPEAEEALLNRTWPGNIRELSNEIEKAVFLESGEFIKLTHLIENVEEPEILTGSHDLPDITLPENGFSLEDLEREIIARSLRLNNGNITKTARYLRISRDTLRYRIEKYGLLR